MICQTFWILYLLFSPTLANFAASVSFVDGAAATCLPETNVLAAKIRMPNSLTDSDLSNYVEISSKLKWRFLSFAARFVIHFLWFLLGLLNFSRDFLFLFKEQIFIEIVVYTCSCACTYVN